MIGIATTTTFAPFGNFVIVDDHEHDAGGDGADRR